MQKGLYKHIWEKHKVIINHCLKNNENMSYNFDPQIFYDFGGLETTDYKFKIEFQNGNCFSCTNSTVARDLMDVLTNSNTFGKYSKGKYVIIKMGIDFNLQIKIKHIL